MSIDRKYLLKLVWKKATWIDICRYLVQTVIEALSFMNEIIALAKYEKYLLGRFKY